VYINIEMSSPQDQPELKSFLKASFLYDDIFLNFPTLVHKSCIQRNKFLVFLMGCLELDLKMLMI